MDVSTRVASDELLARGELSLLGVWMDLGSGVVGEGCVRGIAGMDVDDGWTSPSGLSDGDSMSMDMSMRFSSVTSITAAAFPSSRVSSIMVMSEGGWMRLKSLKGVTQRNTHVIVASPIWMEQPASVTNTCSIQPFEDSQLPIFRLSSVISLGA